MRSTRRASNSSRIARYSSHWSRRRRSVSTKGAPGCSSSFTRRGWAGARPMRSSRAPSPRSRRTASQGRSSASRVSWRWCRGTNNSVAFKSYSSWWLNGTPSGRPGRSSKTRRVQGGEVRPELEALLALQENDQAVMGADAALAAVEPEVLAGRREEIMSGRERALADREAAAASVDSALLTRYERIRRGKAPLALYPLHGDACGRCFTAVPTQRRALIQRGASIESCEACGVLLYAPE